jgi:hypothetical protein
MHELNLYTLPFLSGTEFKVPHKLHVQRLVISDNPFLGMLLYYTSFIWKARTLNIEQNTVVRICLKIIFWGAIP